MAEGEIEVDPVVYAVEIKCVEIARVRERRIAEWDRENDVVVKVGGFESIVLQ